MRAFLLASLAVFAAPARAQPIDRAPGQASDPAVAPAQAEAAAVPSEAAVLPRGMGTLRLRAKRDGVPVFVDDAAIGFTPLPGPWTLLPGPHTIELRPAGGTNERHAVHIEVGVEVVLDVAQAVVEAPVAVVEVPARIVHTGPGFSLATAGYVTAGVGVLALGAGIVLGLDASTKADDAAALDRRDPRNSRADVQSLSDDADRAALWANVSYGVAGVALIGGAALAIFAHDGLLARRPPVMITPMPAGAAVGGVF